MPTSDERPNNINIVGLALSEKKGWGGGWVPYPGAKNLSSLCFSTSPHPSTHTRELKIPFTLTGARSWLEKARDKKRFSTEQNHYNGPALICLPPTFSSPTSANWTLSPCNCHLQRESPSTLNEAVHSNLLQTALWSVRERSSFRLHFLDRSLSLLSFPSFSFFLLPNSNDQPDSVDSPAEQWEWREH